MQKTRLKKKGFTLVELVIVVAVIAVLSAILIPTIGCFVEDAKETSDMTTVKTFNTALARYEAENGKPETMTEALEAMTDSGYNVEKLTPLSTGEVLWDSKNNRFMLVKGDDVLYRDNTTAATEKVDLWKIIKKGDSLSDKYSNYLGDGYEFDGTKAITTGLDVGNNAVGSILYKNESGTPKDVVIRTNSAYTILTIEDKTDGKIEHYGKLGKLVVNECGYNCYYEYGATIYAQATKGKIVAKEGGAISVLYATANTVAAKVDGGTISDSYCVSSNTVEETDNGYTKSSTAKGGNVTFKYLDQNNQPLTAESIENVGASEILESKKVEATDSDNSAKGIVVNVTTGEYYNNDEDGTSALILALDEATDNSYVLVLANITVTLNDSGKDYSTCDKSLWFGGNNITVDLNNHQLVTKSNYGGSYNCLNIFGTGWVIKNGTIIVLRKSNGVTVQASETYYDAEYPYYDSYAVTVEYDEEESTGTFEMEKVSFFGGIPVYGNVTITLSESTYISATNYYAVYLEGSHNCVINSGEYTATGTNPIIYAYVAEGKDFGPYNIEINGGTFHGKIFNGEGTLIIKGGTFDTDPSAYVPEDYTAQNNGDGTWTVIKN